MNQFKQATFGVIYLILKVSFILAGIALWKMPQVHVIVDIPLYQTVGSIILLFLVYLELYAYFTRPVDSKAAKKVVTKPSALDAFKLRFEQTPSK
jgi:uncharacterized membrane protein (DUF373 family)